MDLNFSGFLPVYRSIRATKALNSLERKHLWNELIQEACFTDCIKEFLGKEHDLKKGQLVSTYQLIADMYNNNLEPAQHITKSVARRMLEYFCKHEMIKIDSSKRYIVITICKYTVYNNPNRFPESENSLTRPNQQLGTMGVKSRHDEKSDLAQPESTESQCITVVSANGKDSLTRPKNETGTKNQENPKIWHDDFPKLARSGSPSIEEVISSKEKKNTNTFRPTSSSQDEFSLQPEIECSLSAMPVDADNDPPSKRKQTRKPRPLFDAIAQVCGFTSSDITESLGKQIGKAERELKGFEIKPEQVLQFPSMWKKWPCKNDPIQPHNLIKHAAAIKQIKSANTIVATESDPQYAAKEELRMAQNWLENQLKWVKKNEFNLQKYYSEEERKNISDAIEHKKARIAELQDQLQEGVV